MTRARVEIGDPRRYSGPAVGVSEAARLLNADAETVRWLVAQGTLRVDGDGLVIRADLDRILKQPRHSARPTETTRADGPTERT